MAQWCAPASKGSVRSALRSSDEPVSGQGGIRTHDTVAGMPVFKTGAFNRSATCPGCAGRGETSHGRLDNFREVASAMLPRRGALRCVPFFHQLERYARSRERHRQMLPGYASLGLRARRAPETATGTRS